MDALHIIKSILSVHNVWILFDGSLFKCGLDEGNFRLMLLSIFILFLADLCKKKRIEIRKVIMQQDQWARCLILSCSFVLLLVFGKYGPGYDAAKFIYFQF